jgi:hypothetical protein
MIDRVQRINKSPRFGRGLFLAPAIASSQPHKFATDDVYLMNPSSKESPMRAKCLIPAIFAIAIVGCAKSQNQPASTAMQPTKSIENDQQVDAGEVKVKLEQTPPPVRKTIERELAASGELEDISKQTSSGKTIYEVDIFAKAGGKLEVRVAEDGSVISKIKEGANGEEKAEASAQDASFRQKFDVEKEDLKPTGKNQWLTIQPGRVQKLKSGIDSLTITILPDTKTIDGVKVGILEERETKDGKLIEVSRNYFATDDETGDVYYFGEDVDNYKDGKIVDHESAWHAGEKGARFGLMIPAKPKVGDKFYQEIAPKVAMDRVEIVAVDEPLTTPAGTFKCLHLKETTPLEGEVSHKWYAPGIGMVKDDEFELAEKP